jgi:hypothetical protein
VSRSADDAADIDGIPGLSQNESRADGRWVYVTSAAGKIIGRYAVCFNAIMANDGGYVHETAWQGWYSENDWDAEPFVPCYNYFYNNRARLNRFRVKSMKIHVDDPGTATITLMEPQRQTKFSKTFLTSCDTSWTLKFRKGAAATAAMAATARRAFRSMNCRKKAGAFNSASPPSRAAT